MTLEEFKKKMEEDDDFAPGWDAIEEAFAELYPGQEPAHFGTSIQTRAIFGGDNYLRISESSGTTPTAFTTFSMMT